MLLILILFVLIGYAIGKLIASFIPKEKDEDTKFITHIHQTHNHLHISKEDLKELTDKK